MQAFNYVRVKSTAEALSLLGTKEKYAILAGGTDLLVQLREGRRKADLVIDIKEIPEVNELEFDATSGLKLGAAVSCFRICREPTVIQNYPGLIDALSLIGGVQIQGRASVGGNLCNASPAADSIPALIAHRATCLVASHSTTRVIPVEAFCTAPGQNQLEPGEFLLKLIIPTPPPRFGAAYLRFTPRNEMDIAVAGAAASVILEEDLHTIHSARIALAAVAPTPLLVHEAGEYLAGRHASPENLAKASRIAREAAHPINDMRGSIAQRIHLAGVLTRRALEKALTRARI